MTRKQNLKSILFVLFSLFLLVFANVSGLGNTPAYAVAASASSVLSDLQKDNEFDAGDFPDNAKDYAIYVIQIAESKSKSLYVYTYQPCQKTTYLVATQISMSLTDKMGGEVEADYEFTDEDKPKLYGLTLMKCNGVFCKYKVDGFTVGNDEVRYYNIASIYRAWVKGIDEESGNNNTINEKSFAVRNIYSVSTENGELKYSRNPTYVVNIIAPYSDYLIYIKNHSLDVGPPSIYDKTLWNFFDAHYLAFSTDWDIEHLRSVDVSYYYKSGTGKATEWFGKVASGSVSYGEEKPEIKTVSYDEKFENTYVGWFDYKRSYSWGRIQAVSEFLSSEKNLTDETKENLKGKEWILRFTETERKQTETKWVGGICTEYQVDYTIVDRVTVLRLEFETAGVVFNLGVVSDVVSGDFKPGNVPAKPKLGFWQYVWQCIIKLFNGTANTIEIIVAVVTMLVAVLLAGLVLYALSIILPPVKLALNGIWWFVTLPFRGIATSIKKRKDKEKQKNGISNSSKKKRSR